MIMKMGKYQVYRMYNKENEEYLTEFFLPDDNLISMLNRLNTISSLKSEGFAVIGVVYVNKETYLNLKINDTVDDYCEQDRLEQEYRTRYKRDEISRDVYIDTMKCIQDYKWTLLKKLDMQMRRLYREGYDCDNEVAIQLYDKFLKGICV